jgi:hypothetical protein
MLVTNKEYWLAMCHPTEVFSAIERVIRWMTFGLYKPWLVSTICGVLEEWKECRNARDYEGTCD